MRKVHIAKHVAVMLVVGTCISTSFVARADNPKREMRATYLTTVANIDWPKNTGAASQKTEMLRMLDSIAALKLNAVLFQVRPCCDAFYQSAYEPWSSYLKVSRGTDPGYDPLAFVLEESHKRGLAVHAWLNPYRYSNRQGTAWTNADDTPLNYDHTHPDWLLYYSSSIILDPARPEVVQRICDVVGDILSKYDVDGIIFDDYFYPYGGTTNQDSTSQRLYKPAGMDVGDWRRSNVNTMVKAVYDTIQAVAPWVTFGISPFGIWTTSYTVAQQEGITLPSGITGGNMYAEIYCDPVAWLKEGSVDYVSPQLYWRTGGSQDYRTLCPWWANLCNQFGKHMYSSMANYKYSEQSDSHYTVSELQTQVNVNRSSAQDNAPGSIFYNTRAWVFDKPFRSAFRAEQYLHPALPPAINWKPATDRSMVSSITITGDTVRWTHPDSDVHFAVYAVANAFRNRLGIFSTGDALLGITYNTYFVLPAGFSTGANKVAVSVVDKYNNEYSLRVYGETEEAQVACEPTYPVSGQAFSKWPITFRWNAVTKADSYVLQIADDPDFRHILVTQEMTGTTFNSAARKNLKGEGEFYWRVRTRKPNADDVWSETCVFFVGDYEALPEEQAETHIMRPGVYSLLGVYLGDDATNLPKGAFIINGRLTINNE